MGTYRDGIRLLPIKLRAPEDERGSIETMRDIQVWSPVLGRSVPVSAGGVRLRNPLGKRGDPRPRSHPDHHPLLQPRGGELATSLFERLRPQIEAIELPPGYSLAWGGEYEDSVNAQKGSGRAHCRWASC